MHWRWPWERRPWAWLLLAACLVAYANGLTGDFTYDDKAIVRDNPRIQSWSALPQVLTTHYFGGPIQTGTAYRPVDLLTFAANYAIHGRSTFGYHLVNLALHTANVLLLFLLLRRRFPEETAGAAALLFAVLPVHVEAVTSIVGRAELLAAFFTLLAFFAAERARRRRSAAAYAGACGAYLLAIFSKESAVVFPGLLFLYDLTEGEGGPAGRAGALLRRRAAFYVGFAVPLAASFAARLAVLHGLLMSKSAGVFDLENPLVRLSPFARVGSACAVLLRGIGRTVFPLYLSADESARQLPLLSPRQILFWLSLAAVASIVAAAVALGTTRRASSFGIAFFLLAILPTANLLFVTGTIMAERLLYLPSAGAALVLADALTAGGAGLARSRIAATALAVYVVLLTFRTIVRNPVWDSDLSLFGNLIQTSPDSAKAHYDFAYAQADRGRHWPAYVHYRRATGIFVDYYDAWAGRARMAGEIGNFTESVDSARRSVEIFPTYENGWFSLGFSLERRGDLDEAGKAYREGAAKCPKSFPLAYHSAALLARRGRLEEAVGEYRRASALAPDSALVHEDLGRLFASRGREEKAEEEWDIALSIFPTDGVALGGLARIAEARKDFEEAADLRSRLFEASRDRPDLLLLLADAGRSPAAASQVRTKSRRWARQQPALFSDPAVAARLRALPAP
jgi:tetratricopeptide (TPR) repeat protein